MPDHNPADSNLYALLIGIDCYLPNQLPDGTYFLNLHGCVRDILSVEDFLHKSMLLPPERIIRLTATDNGTGEPAEPPELWPTDKNIVEAFKKLAETAQPGDQVYIHYSGHGGRVRTPVKYRHIKGGDGYDEVLVPTNISNSEDHYLRDFELAKLLRDLVDGGRLVTIVLDSCHAGSATRSESKQVMATNRDGSVNRTIGQVDTILPDKESLVGTDAELMATWRSLREETKRDVQSGGGWQLEPEGYVLLSACRAHEYAREFPFDGKVKRGVLTYWLIDSLRQLGTGCSYQALYDRIFSKIYSQYPNEQTPQLQGEANRVVFGGARIRPHLAIVVLEVVQNEREILLNVGQAQGIARGALFAIYPANAENFSEPGDRLALAEITRPAATVSRAKIVEQFNARPVEQGDQAVLLETGAGRLSRTVRIDYQNGVAPDGELGQAIERKAGGLLRIALKREEPADFIITVTADEKYLVSDKNGNEIPNLGPALAVSDSHALDRLIAQLSHLAKYRNVYELADHTLASAIAGKVTAQLLGVQADYYPGDKPAPQPFDDAQDTPTLKVGEWTFLHIKNNSAKVFNITVLDLRPDWSIRQVYPAGAAFFEPLDPGKEIQLPLQAGLPAHLNEGRDTLHIFATTGAPNFRWLELPALNHTQRVAEVWRGAPPNPLQQLLDSLRREGQGTRDFSSDNFVELEWVTLSVELEVTS